MGSAAALAHDKLFIGGEWSIASGGTSLDVVNPTSEAAIAAVVEADASDVNRAVEAAAAAFDGWAGTSRRDRAGFLRGLADGLERRRDEVARLIVDEVGTPIRIAERIQATLPITVLRGYADLLAEERPEERIANSLVLREPVGVVAAITPWNYPLHQVVAKVAPALAAGCPVVVKPSEVAPLTALLLAEVAAEAGLPAGALNVVTGGASTGEALIGHPEVDAVSFTGSVATGGRVAAIAAPAIKRVTLELGGKSANVVLEDADLATAVKVGVANAFLNAGQTCAAWTRLVVPSAAHDDACELARGFAETFTPGDPTEPSTKLGPLASATQRDRVRRYINLGIEEGCQLVTGGSQPPENPGSGFFVQPTVFGEVDPEARIAQEEIFGPVLSIIRHRGDEDAIRIANNSSYGLAGAVWSGDEGRALAVAKRLRTGSVDVNGAPYNPLAPFGGYKQSGLGREMGAHGLEDFEEVKAVQLP